MFSQRKVELIDSVKHYGIILLGTCILAFGLFNVHSQSKITEGGVLGLILFIQYWFNISPSISGFILNLLCYLLGYKLLGKSFLKDAMFANICFAIIYNIFERIGYVLPDLSSHPLLVAVVGGMFVGVGVGLAVREGAATGGDDALAMVISDIFKCEISKAYLFTDLIILILSLSYISIEHILFSLISVMISSILIGKFQLPEVTEITGNLQN